MRRPLDLLAIVVILLAALIPSGYAVQELLRVRDVAQQIELHRETAQRLLREGQYPQARSEVEQVLQLRLLGQVLWTEPTTGEELRSITKFVDVWLIRDKAVSIGADPDTKLINEVLDTRLAYRFLGSRRCLMCHSQLHRVHVETWKPGKMANTYTIAKIDEVPEPERQKCLPCHTTGYNPVTKQYSEPGVTCEACHGPGERFAYLMASGRSSEGKVFAIGNIWNGNPCARCHSPKRIPHSRKAY